MKLSLSSIACLFVAASSLDKYAFVPDKSCEAYGMESIHDAAMCKAAGTAFAGTHGIREDFKFFDRMDFVNTGRPNGCSYHPFGNVEQWHHGHDIDCNVGNFAGCFCKIVVPECDSICGCGYEFTNLDVDGPVGEKGRSFPGEGIENSANACNQRDGCWAFEYNHKGNEEYACQTYTSGQSKLYGVREKWHLDWHTCVAVQTLTQDDFDDGTVRITSSGIYRLGEDIVFNPLAQPGSPNEPGAYFPSNNALFPGSADQTPGQYGLGFFTAISIEASDVTIDMSGHSLAYGFEYYLQQRWGSLIEIANSAFMDGVGPFDFINADIEPFVAVQNIEIKNGIFGLTSHHSIHSNSAKNVVIKDCEFRDFEVGAIQLNGFNGATLENLEIGPSLGVDVDVPVAGYYSNARFILLALRGLLNDDSYDTSTEITFNGGRATNLQQIHDNLEKAMDLIFESLTHDVFAIPTEDQALFTAASDLFLNPTGMPDGSATYGILFNSKNPAVHGFGVSPDESEDEGNDLTITNVDITGLRLSANEIPVLYFDKCYGRSGTKMTVQKGPFGDVFDLKKAVSAADAALIERHSAESAILSSIQYVGNPLSDAQIALGLFSSTASGAYKFGTAIDSKLSDWAQDSTANPFPSHCADFVCNGDIMFHTNKGIMGARIDGIEDAKISDLTISDLVNESPLVSSTCGRYEGPHDGGSPGQEDNEGGMGTDVRGLLISRGDVQIIGASNINGLESHFGDVVGIDIINEAIVDFDDQSNIFVNDLISASALTSAQYVKLVERNKTPYPNNFGTCTIEIESGSRLTGDVPDVLSDSSCMFDEPTTAENILCDEDEWNIIKGTWAYDEEKCILSQTLSGSDDLVWFGSSDGASAQI